jgi:hypothetical protein
MAVVSAIRVAIDLLHLPTRSQSVRASPLPPGVDLLLRIVIADEAAIDEAVAVSGRPRGTVIEAAHFFVEQILLSPDADCYRVLGVEPYADASELRRNMALLVRWLHPDLDPTGSRSAYAARVTTAWNTLKSAERRASYDAARETRPRPSRRKAKPTRPGGPRRPYRSSVAKPYLVDPEPPWAMRWLIPRPGRKQGFFARAIVRLLSR